MDWFGNTAVYTCVTNGFDYTRHQKMIDGVDFYYFTDGKNDPSPQIGWKVCRMSDATLSDIDPRRSAKIIKVNPFMSDILKGYRYTIWIDGSMQIMSSTFVPEILSYLSSGMVISPHFDGRKCAYGEATIRPAKYAKEPLDQQVEFYKKEGFPENYGLYECGLMARDMTNSIVKDFSDLWLEQNFSWSYKDQVSFPYCLWKLNYVPDILPKSFRDFQWVHINAHAKEG